MRNIKSIFIQIVLILFVFIQVQYGQVKLSIYSGYSLSSFEEQENSADMLPIGFQAYYSLESVEFVSFNFGLDFNYSVIPFAFEIFTTDNQKVFTREQSQLHIGALVKVKFVKEFILNPYVRLGMGLYSGGHSLEFTDAIKQQAAQQQIALPDELDISSGFGFNFGSGLDIKFTQSGSVGMFLEFVYHLNSRELDETPLNIFEGATFKTHNIGLDNWAILIGFQIGF